MSHPSWVCGLKLADTGKTLELGNVTPFVGVWIETEKERSCQRQRVSHPSWVCGLKLILAFCFVDDKMSHPSWVCGLKQKLM